MRDSFSTYHPIVNFIYFVFAFIFSMCFLHPVCLVISFGSAFAWSVYLGGRKTLRANLLLFIPILLIMSLVNPAFSHAGVTILAYLPSGNPLTLESIVFGVGSAVMLVSVIAWFSCYTKIMTSDKFVYLFGRLIPALSLILSMVLRFVPKFRAQIKVISDAQRCIGRDVSNGSLIARAKHELYVKAQL